MEEHGRISGSTTESSSRESRWMEPSRYQMRKYGATSCPQALEYVLLSCTSPPPLLPRPRSLLAGPSTVVCNCSFLAQMMQKKAGLYNSGSLQRLFPGQDKWVPNNDL